MNTQSILDSMWLLICALLVFFMHAGFALVESGFCRRKNAVMVLTKNVTVVAIASLLFYAVGFGLMFGEGNAWLGMEGWLPAADTTFAALPEGIPLFVFLFFQLVFAATAATIVSGAVAERAALLPFMLFTVLATGLIYPIVGHWVWGGGLLAAGGFHDFAGSTVVHAVGGAMALAGVLVVGPRLGKYGTDGHARPIPAHNLPMASLGVLILWLGWFGFNGGSTLAADVEAIAAVILVTNLSASTGFLAALLYIRWRTGKLDLSIALNGALAGLVAITAGADVIGPLEAILVGAMAGVLVVEGVFAMDRLRLDDPVGAIPVHGLCGVFGTLAVGLFASGDEIKGLFHGGGTKLLTAQLIGSVTAVGFALLAGGLVWLTLAATLGVRVAAEHELEGLDKSECGLDAYGFDPNRLAPPLRRPDATPRAHAGLAALAAIGKRGRRV